MKNKQQKELDSFIKKVLISEELETPSTNFTDTIITKIESKAIKKVKPLIPIWGWLTTILVLATSIFLSYRTENNSYNLLEKIGLKKHIDLNFKFDINLPEFMYSQNMLYAICFTCFFIFIQINYLQYFFNKKYYNN